MKTKFSITILLCAISFLSFGQKDTLVEIKDLSIDPMGDLKWTTTAIVDLHGISANIEQFKGGKWIKVGEAGYMVSQTKAPGDSAGTVYKWTSFKNITKHSVRLKFHKGENRFRIRVTYPSKFITAEVVLNSRVANDDGSLWIVANKILLDQKEKYEILNSVGATILKGEGETIDISGLPHGSYFFYTIKSSKPFVK